ncbi:MAG TPA: phosphotransferase [Dongiaceae bacterium]|nr:phosphotransferase [Dongiaceae bacterium]
MEFARRTFGPAATVTEVAGDASTRRFYRAAAARQSTAIVMAHGEALPPDAPFYSNHRILAAIGAPVPRILDRDDPAGLVLVEDFGDLTLQRHLAEAGGRAAPPLYRQAADLIVLMQRQAPGAIRPSDFAARNALDRDRFLFELDHFQKHFIGGLRGLSPTAAEVRHLGEFYDDLASACDRLARVYCHRDYQSRNLMLRGAAEGAPPPDGSGRLGLIDIQDARMGPYCYDAASLLRDSSLDLEAPLVESVLDRLATGSAAPLGIGPEEFRRDFDLMALERNLKDLGTFGFMATVRGRREYLDYVPRTIAWVRRTLAGNRRWHDAFNLMERLVLDWRP